MGYVLGACRAGETKTEGLSSARLEMCIHHQSFYQYDSAVCPPGGRSQFTRVRAERSRVSEPHVTRVITSDSES